MPSKKVLSIFLLSFFIHFCITLQAQNKSKEEMDKLYLNKKEFNIVKDINEDFTSITHYVILGINQTKQNIAAGNYNSYFNYQLVDYNSTSYKPGYFIGYRNDGFYKEKIRYSLGLILSKVVSGTAYSNANNLPPFISEFTHFKAEDAFINLSITPLLKQLVFTSENAGFKFLFVGGPTFDIKLSRNSAANIAYNPYHKIFVSGKIGIEFENHSYYSLFLHYKHGLSSITIAPIKTTLYNFEMGILIKPSDLF
jgi:hypothetical protein